VRIWVERILFNGTPTLVTIFDSAKLEKEEKCKCSPDES
jgi:hypothetical protein